MVTEVIQLQERLQKFLARCGIASRRKCERLIADGLVSVNGKVVDNMGIRIDGEKDIVRFRGRIVKPERKYIYIMLNKPCGVVSTVSEQFNRPKVTDFVPDVRYRLYPVGRLDFDSSGLILLTNDGNVTYKLTHPGSEIDKTYLVTVCGIPDSDDVDRLSDGVDIGGFVTSKAAVRAVSSTKDTCTLTITIHEGKNRQIRRMCSAIGHEVADLKRISIGEIKLGGLREGEWRYLTEDEMDYLSRI